MLVVSARIRLDAAKREVAIEAAEKMMVATLEEPGCREYVFTADLRDPAVFRIFEEWDDEAALKAHFGTPHMAEFQGQMGGLGIEEMVAHKYTVTEKGPIA